MSDTKALVAVIMGSKSDWEEMRHAVETLEKLNIPCDVRALSAHRTHDAVVEFIQASEKNGVEVFIAGAGGAAHLAGVVAALTTAPVLGVPMKSAALNGIDSLLSTVQMPAGIPVATLAIGKPGCINAALFAAAILGTSRPEIRKAIAEFRKAKADAILAQPDPRR